MNGRRLALIGCGAIGWVAVQELRPPETGGRATAVLLRPAPERHPPAKLFGFPVANPCTRETSTWRNVSAAKKVMNIVPHHCFEEAP